MFNFNVCFSLVANVYLTPSALCHHLPYGLLSVLRPIRMSLFLVRPGVSLTVNSMLTNAGWVTQTNYEAGVPVQNIEITVIRNPPAKKTACTHRGCNRLLHIVRRPNGFVINKSVCFVTAIT